MQNHLRFAQKAHVDNLYLDDSRVSLGLKDVYDGPVKGYSGHFTPETVDLIRQMPEVDYIEVDQIVRTMEFNSTGAMSTQNGAPWGLARISHRKKLSLGTFTKYVYDSRAGEGVDVYVIDTGINIHHKEFGGRASWGKTIPQGDVDEDGNGHGTHCAGTIASAHYGVAKNAHVVAVKVLGSNGSGSMSDVVNGVVFAAEAAKSKAEAAAREFAATGYTAHKGSVASMSLGGGKSRALDQTVNAAVRGGLHFAVAAGNDDRDACNYSPAASEEAITVGASTIGDERAYFSNWGKCVDVFGPGLNIRSTYIGSNTATATLSGTSMATPHVAGLIAYLISIYGSETFSPKAGTTLVPASAVSSVYSAVHSALPSWVSVFLPSPQLVEEVASPAPMGPATITTKELKNALLELSTPDKLGDLPSFTPNLLIFNNATA
jgi:cerevisin